MPRLNNKTRTTELIATDYYDHNQNYISQNSEKVYTQKENLVFWSDFCGDKTDSIQALGNDTFIKVADDRSLNSSDISLFTSKIAKTQVFQQSDSAKFSYLTSRLPRNLRSYLSMKNMSLCGDNCYWLNTTMISAPSKDNNCLATNIGDDKLFIDNISNINFANAGATQDTPFTISIWYHPVDSTQNPQRVYDRGGTLRLNSPAIFHKTFQYGLFIKECGKLEFTLFDVDITSGLTGTTYSYLGTSSTLSVRSSANILKPGEWNHICVTYDGSGTRAGMKIYVNCVDSTNTSDVPSVVASRSRSFSGADKNTWVSTHQAFMSDVLGSAGEGETPADYTAMHTYTTPLIFASTAIPANASSMISLSKTNMIYARGTQLPNSLLFDIAIWSSALSAEDVGAVCDSTRNCILENSDVFGRDSGYVNLSPKIMQKIRDQKKNNLSVIDRVGDRSDRRVKSRNPFNDQNSLIFGSKISEKFKKEFKFLNLNITDKERITGIPSVGIIPDEKLWLVNSASIRREQKIDNGEKIYDKALSLSSKGESWIQTKDYFNNAIIYYELILGPYNNLPGHLNLSSVPLVNRSGTQGSNLFVEIQLQGSSNWQVIKTHSVTKEITQEAFYSANFTSGIKLTPQQHKFRRSFKIHFSEINASGQIYKIRFRTNESCWGIGSIEILSANQSIRAPLLIDHDEFAGKYIDQNLIATPHTRSNIEVVGRTVSGISDTSVVFKEDNQDITSFKDNVMIPFAGNSFFDEGVEAAIISGFSAPLKDKTQFTIELNSSSEKTLGMTGKHPINLNSTSGNSVYTAATDTNVQQGVNVYWNNQSKSFFSAKAWTAVNYKDTLYNALLARIGQAYSTIDTVATASISESDLSNRSKEALASFAQPVTSFGYPVSHEFCGSYDSGISMKDYITKPFLLEKVVFEFDSRFEFANNVNTGSQNAYKLSYSFNQTATSKPSKKIHDSSLMIIPSFSLIRLEKNSGKLYSRNFKIEKQNGSFERRDSIESTANDAFGTSFDRTSGEMITYAQMNLYASSSNSKIDVENLLNSGLSRDANYEINSISNQPESWATSGLNAITGSFKIEAPVRNMPIVSETQRIYQKDAISGELFAVFSGNPTGGRGLTIKDKLSTNTNKTTFNIGGRGLINNIDTIDKINQKKYKINAFFTTQEPYDVTSSGNLVNSNQSISPYIIMPDDRITLTCHYPLPAGGIEAIPGNTDTSFNQMTIGKNFKIHLYGSLIKTGKEYHENMNQALTTIEISEPIGCESVIDKFNISTKDCYYKSYLDRVPIKASALDLSGTGNALGAQVYNFKNVSSGIGSTHLFGTPSISPLQRIGLKVGSKIHPYYTYQVASSSITEEGKATNSQFNHNFTGGYILPEVQPIIGTIYNKPQGASVTVRNHHYYKKNFTFPFTEHYNNNRRYHDEGKLLLTSSNGIIMFISGVMGKNEVVKSREKYVFSHSHFGHHADIIDTAKDSKFKPVSSFSKISRNVSFVDFVASPVKVSFVTGSIDKDGIQNYHKIENTKAKNSSNLSIRSEVIAAFNDSL